MAEIKTQRNAGSVDAFLDGIEEETKRGDARRIVAMMEEATGEPPAMWGEGIVGFGTRRLKYASGREVEWMLVGYAPRKANHSLYLPGGFESLGSLLERLGKHKRGGGCLLLKRLADVDLATLRELLTAALASIADGGDSKG